jgi:iron complex outermembrane recepter protein
VTIAAAAAMAATERGRTYLWRFNSCCNGPIRGSHSRQAVFRTSRTRRSWTRDLEIAAAPGPGLPTFPEPDGFLSELDEDNTSWRVGVNWRFADARMIYANISKGYKAGSFPTVATAASVQLQPATQEELLAYEIGTKMLLLGGALQFNAAAFYYDYTDKQVLGAINDPIFGSLPALVNVPESEVVGAEFAMEWYPVEGLRIAPSLSYADSEVKGEFRNFDPFFSGTFNPGDKDFSGQSFPNAPKWTGNLDAQYEWRLATA